MKKLLLALCCVISALHAYSIERIIGGYNLCIGTTTVMNCITPGGTWSSSNPAVCNIGSVSGIVSGVSVGSATITYIVGTDYTTKVIEVASHPPYLNSIRPTVCKRAVIRISNNIGGGYYYSSNPAIMSIDSTTGIATAIARGIAVITYDTRSVCGMATYNTTVLPFNTPIITGNTDMCIGLTYNYTIDTIGGTWSATGSTFNINTTSGIATPFRDGEGRVDYTATTGCIGVYDVYVHKGAFPITGPSSACVGSIIPIYSGGGYGHFWHSSDTTVATVFDASPKGLVTSVSVGTTIITYSTNENCIATKTITVTTPTCTGTPIAGVATYTTGGLPSGLPDTLILSGYTTCGTTIQWQTSQDSITWVDIPRATYTPAECNPFNSAFYRCKTRCISSGGVAYSNTIFIPKRYTITDHSILSTQTTSCTPTRFCLKASGVSNTLNAITRYGDGFADTAILNPSTTCNAIFTHDYLLPGAYTVKHIVRKDTTPVDSVTFTYNNLYCKIFPVRFYFDNNSNGNFDTGEIFSPTLIRTIVDSNGIPIDTISSVGGFYYHANGPTGSVYTFRVMPEPNFTITTPLLGYISDTVSAIVNNYNTKYFGISCGPAPNDFDLSIGLHNIAIRNGCFGTIFISNKYCKNVAPIVTYTFSPKLVFDSSMPLPSSVVGNTATWYLDSLCYLGSSSITYNFVYRDSLLTIGDTIQNKITASPFLGDVDTLNNRINRIAVVRASYDPNMIEVNPEGLIIPCTELTYTVHFENTGNDTAYNVHVMDTLPIYVDMKTLEMVYASAAMNVMSMTETGQNVVKFDFPNIKLWDSSHKDKNKGMFQFKVKVKNGLADGIDIPNRVGIYFDYNDVVMTNTVENIIGMSPILGPDTVCKTGETQLTCASQGGVWKASNTNATVDNGLVKGIKAGYDTIKYTLSNACTTRTRTKIITVQNTTNPSISIVPPAGPLCSGMPVTLNTLRNNEGAMPLIQWKVNDVNVGTGLSYKYIPANRDAVTVALTVKEHCAIPNVAVDNDTLSVTQSPTLTLLNAPGSTIAPGKPDTFVVSGTNLGATPVYHWFINGKEVQKTADSILVVGNLFENDNVTCVVSTNSGCDTNTNSATWIVHGSGNYFWPLYPTVAPNPNNGSFTLKGSIGNQTFTGLAQITVRNAIGQSFYTGVTEVVNGAVNQYIPLNENIARGLYIATLKANDTVVIIKFVVE